MNENFIMMISFLAILLAIVALITGLGVKPVDVDVNTVGTNEIIDDSITTNDILDNSILPNDLHDSVTNRIVSEFEILADAVSSDNIVDESIIKDDIADDSISSEEIIDFSVNTSDIMNGSITNDKLSGDALQWNDINGMPIEVFSAGYIKSDSTLEYGYNLVSANYDSSSKFYQINTNGYDYNNDYITVVTPYGFGVTAQVAHSVYGPTIWFANSTNYVQTDFYFVTYILN